MKDDLVKGLYRLTRSTVIDGGGVAPRKNRKSVEVELDGKTEDVTIDISKEAYNSGPK